MSVLSAQTIRRLSLARSFPLIEPFVERGVMNGKSFGLSACTYDCRIDHDLVLNPNSAALASTMEYVPAQQCLWIDPRQKHLRSFVYERI
jgi:deoxycytidine triphosphate deaminase